MIDIDKYRARFEERCLAAGLTKLDEPVDAAELLYTAFELRKGDAEENFDAIFFEPTMKSMIRAIAEEEGREFYRLGVNRRKNVFFFTASRGDVSWKLALRYTSRQELLRA